MNPLVADYLAKKYPEKFAELAAEREKVAKEYDQTNEAPGVGGNLLMGLVGALKSDKSYADVANDERLQREAERENVVKPVDEKQKALVDQMKVEDSAFEGVQSRTKAGREDVSFERDEQDFDPKSERSALAYQTVKTFAPTLAHLAEGKSASEITKLFPWITKKLEQDFRASEAQKNRQAQIDIARGRVLSKPSKPVEAKDKDYAKHYNEFTEGGAVNAKTAIDNLEKLASEMEKDPTGGGGRFAQEVPDWLRSRTAIQNRDNARNFANVTLKKLFGGQLSDAEREAAAREYYNDALDNKANAQLIRNKVKQLRQSYDQEVDKAKYFEANDTLAGWKANLTGQPEEGGELKVGDVKDGYKYLGGDPGDPESWEEE